MALAGAGLAWKLYAVPEPTEQSRRLGWFYRLAARNYYQDEYQVWLANRFTANVARAADKFDLGIVDGVVNGISSLSLFAGSRIRRIQTGIVSNYAALLTIGLVLLVVVAAVVGGWF